MTRFRIARTPARVSLALALHAAVCAATVMLAQPACAATTRTVSTCDESDLDAAAGRRAGATTRQQKLSRLRGGLS